MNFDTEDFRIISRLDWPQGWPRANPSSRKQARFREQDRQFIGYAETYEISIGTALDRLYDALRLLGAQSILVTGHFSIRHGRLFERDREPADTGVAVYWNGHRCIAIDIYDRLADNIAAIAATLNAFRAIERHGGATILERAFTGLTALPAPKRWFEVLGVPEDATVQEIDRAFRRLAKKHHPDNGGSHEEMARINVAREEGHRAATQAA